MTLKRVAESQIICDCQGNTPATWIDKLMVGIEAVDDKLVITVYCPSCNGSMIIRLTCQLIHDLN